MGSKMLAHIGVRRGSTAALLAVAVGAAAFWLAGPSDGKSPPGRGAAGAATVSLGKPFFRAVYGYGGTRLSAVQEGARYRVMVMQESDAWVIPQLKAGNPSLRVYMYVDMMGADRRDPGGTSDWAGYTDAVTNHADWFLRDANGNRLVFKNYPSGFVMDVGNADYQNSGVARVVALAKAGGFDGIFLDDANASLRWIISGGAARCVTYPTDAAWQGAVYSFLTNVAPQLHDAGLLVVANIGGSTITPGLWQKWNGPIDGAMEESYTNGGAGRDSIKNRQWLPKLNHTVWSEANGKISLDHAVTATRTGARYGLATMLLAARGESMFSASTSSTELWWPEYRTSVALGAPLGPYRVLPNGDYRRNFTHGVVLVNPHARATSVVDLGATYVGSQLGRVRKVKLQRTSGVVLLRSR
jgi:hypothetical protein